MKTGGKERENGDASEAGWVQALRRAREQAKEK